MANTTIQLKKSGVTGNVPSNLGYGELALNYYDGKLFYKAANGSIVSFTSGGGGTVESFATVNANSTLILATSPTDTLSFTGSNGISITANSTSKTINIGDGVTFALANSAYTIAQLAYAEANTETVRSGWAANTILSVNSTGYISNSGGLFFTSSNNNLIVSNNIITGSGTGGNISGANNIFANTVNVSVSMVFGDGSIQTTAYNGGAGIDNFARQTANAAFIKANSATILAQAAYNQANTGGGGGTSSNNFVLFDFPLGDRGLVTQSIYGGLGNEQIGEIYDMRIDPTYGGIIVLDCLYLS